MSLHDTWNGKACGRLMWCALMLSLILMAFVGCGGECKYSGQVVSAETGKPVAGAEVEGSWIYHKEFAPSMDGLYTRATKEVETKTNRTGHFEITLRGFAHKIDVKHREYKYKRIIMSERNKCWGLTIRLERDEDYK